MLLKDNQRLIHFQGGQVWGPGAAMKSANSVKMEEVVLQLLQIGLKSLLLLPLFFHHLLGSFLRKLRIAELLADSFQHHPKPLNLLLKPLPFHLKIDESFERHEQFDPIHNGTRSEERLLRARNFFNSCDTAEL